MKKKLTITAVALVVTCAAIGAWLYNMAFSTPDGDKTLELYIPANISEDSLQTIITEQLGDDFGNTVLRIFRWRDGSVDRAHGYYAIQPSDRAWSVANRLRTGTQTPRTVTFNNLRTMEQLANRLSDKFEWDANAFISAADTLLPDLGFSDRTKFPAAFTPDSYEFYYTDTPAKVITTLVDYRNKFWTEARRNQAKKLGLNPVEVTTIASIVEEETAKVDERGKVARLYLNRLDAGMKLQADPTVKFAIGDFTIKRIKGDMLNTKSPYNTYYISGLPPGPIRIPDKSTIDAVLNAPQHNNLYMCAKSDFSGYHDFAITYEQHLQNARAYQQKLNQLNIK